MSIVLAKGSAYTYSYSSPDYPVLDNDWVGSVAIYATYPGQPVIEIPMSRIGNVMIASLSIEDIMNLNTGVYTVISTMSNPVIGESVGLLEYATVTSVSAISSTPMTTLTMTITKVDGTSAGKETRTLTNTVDGAMIVLGWDGVTVTASHPVADEVTGVIVGTETVSTKTNAAGYAQLAVIKGQTVTITCPSFGKTVTVDTTGLDEIDLSSYF